MPLPFAPPPDESKLYQQLESTTLQTLTSDQLDTIRAKTFSQGTEGNEDEYRRLLLLGTAANQLSTSGPMPGSMVMQETTVTDGTGTAMLTCPEGQVLQVINYNYKAVGSSGTLTFTGFMGPKGQEAVSEQGGIRILYYQSAASTPVINSDADYRALSPLVIDENFQLGFTLTGTFTSATVRVMAIRVR